MQYVMGQNGQYLLVVGLSCYKWYHSKTVDGVLARMLGPKEVDCEILHRLDRGIKTLWGSGNISLTDGISARLWVLCQQGCWSLRVGGLWDLTLVGKGNKALLIKVWKHLPSRWYQCQTHNGVPTRMLSPKGGCIVRSHISWRGKQNPSYKGVETSP